MVSSQIDVDPGTREAILTSAVEAFSSEGLSGARVDRIAADADVNKALIYYYFKSKEELYEAVLLRLFAPPVEAVEALEKRGGKPLEKLRLLYTRLAAHFAENPALPRIMMRELLSGGVGMATKAGQSLGRVLAFVKRTIDEGVDSGEFRRVDPLLFHITLMGPLLVFYGGIAFRGRVLKSHVPAYPVPTDARVVGHIADMLERGLLPETRS